MDGTAFATLRMRPLRVAKRLEKTKSLYTIRSSLCNLFYIFRTATFKVLCLNLWESANYKI